MGKRIIVVLLVGLALTLFGLAEAQQPKKVPRIGYLSNDGPALESTRSEGIRLALRERGYIEGQNITTDYRYADGKPDRYPELAAELVRLKVDVIVLAGGAGPSGRECDQDDSHRYGGPRARPSQGRPS
jgi:putative ABC transport system substrate-binding protein